MQVAKGSASTAGKPAGFKRGCAGQQAGGMSALPMLQPPAAQQGQETEAAGEARPASARGEGHQPPTR